MRLPKLTALILLAGAFAAGCGGGGGGSAPDLNGWWELSVRQPGPTDPFVFIWLGPTAQSGSDVVYLDIEFTYDGTTLHGADPDFSSAARQEYHLTHTSADFLEGQGAMILPGTDPAYRDIRMRRVPTPTGSITGAGTAGGAPLDWSCPTAYAVVEQTPVGANTDYEVQIVDAGPTAAASLGLVFTLTPWVILPITKSVPANARAGLVRKDGSYYEATDGTVVFDEFVPDGRIRGYYQLVLGLDGTAEGTFDVQVRGRR